MPCLFARDSRIPTTPKMNTNLLRTFLAVLTAASVTGLMSAHSASPAPAKEEVLELDKFSVNGVAPDQQILPTARPFNSVFGTDDSIVEIGRAHV